MTPIQPPTRNLRRTIRNIGCAASGYRVDVDVRISYQGAIYSVYTWFRPD